MQWTSIPNQPGYLRYEAKTDAGYFLCQKKSGTGRWMLAFKVNTKDPLKIIFVAGTLKSCKEYAERYEPA